MCVGNTVYVYMDGCVDVRIGPTIFYGIFYGETCPAYTFHMHARAYPGDKQPPDVSPWIRPLNS